MGLCIINLFYLARRNPFGDIYFRFIDKNTKTSQRRRVALLKELSLFKETLSKNMFKERVRKLGRLYVYGATQAKQKIHLDEDL